MSFLMNAFKMGCEALDLGSKVASVAERAKETKKIWDQPANSKEEKKGKG